MKKGLITTFILFPIVFLAFIISHYAVNSPWLDDFEVFPDFIRELYRANGFFDKAGLLFSPQNEHRSVFLRLLALGFYKTTGQLNFYFLYAAGFTLTSLSCFLFFRAFRANNLPLLYFLPIPFLLFQVQYHLIFLWAVCGLQHQSVVFFICLTMFLLAKQRFGWAILSGLCANFAMSNGIFVWVGGAVVLVYQRQFRWLGLWILAAITGISLYLNGMSSQSNESSFAYFRQHPDETFLGFFTFLGGLFDFIPYRSIRFRTTLPIAAGFLLCSTMAIWLWKIGKKWFQKTPQTIPNVLLLFTLGMLGFLFSNAAVIAILRPRFGFFVMVVSNYKIYPALFMALVYTAWLSVRSPAQLQSVFSAGLVVALLVWGLSLVHYLPAISERRKSLLVHAHTQEDHGFGLGFAPKTPMAIYIDSLMKEMTQKKIYQYPSDFRETYQKIRTTPSRVCPFAASVKITADELQMSEPSQHYPSSFNGLRLVFLRSSQQLYVFKMEPRYNQSRNVFRTFADGSSVSIPRIAIEKGHYELGFAEITDQATKMGVCQVVDL